MSAESDYFCDVCGYEWETSDYSGCPKCNPPATLISKETELLSQNKKLRSCIAKLREDMSDCFVCDKEEILGRLADSLNDSMEIALKYRCYKHDI